MPLKRLERTRRSLPAGYRFGDAGPQLQITEYGEGWSFRIFNRGTVTVSVERIFHDGKHWNVIEGESH